MYGQNELDWSQDNIVEALMDYAHQVVKYPKLLQHLHLDDLEDGDLRLFKWHKIAPMWWENPLLRADMIRLDESFNIDDRIFIPHLINTIHADDVVHFCIEHRHPLTKDEYDCLSEDMKKYWISSLSEFGDVSRLLSTIYEPSMISTLTDDDFGYISNVSRVCHKTYADYILLQEKETIQWMYLLLHPEKQPSFNVFRIPIPLSELKDFSITSEHLKVWSEQYGEFLLADSHGEAIESFLMQVHRMDDKEWQLALLHLNDNFILSIDGLLHILDDRLNTSDGFYERFDRIAEQVFARGDRLQPMDILLAYHGYDIDHDAFEEEVYQVLNSLPDIVGDDDDRYRCIVNYLNSIHMNTNITLHL